MQLSDRHRRLCLGVFMASLAGGGLEKTMVTIAAGLAGRGHSVTLLPCRRKGRLEVRPRRAAAADPSDLAEQVVRLPAQRWDR